MELKFAIIILAIVVQLLKADINCSDTKNNHYAYYQNQVEWRRVHNDIWTYIKSVKTSKASCNINPSILYNDFEDSDHFKLFSSMKNCSGIDSNGISIYKNGKIIRIHDEKDKESTNICYEMSDRINYIEGTFEHGYLEGKVKIKFVDDESEIIGSMHKSVLHGKVYLKDNIGHLQSIGHYKNGKWFKECSNNLIDFTFPQIIIELM